MAPVPQIPCDPVLAESAHLLRVLAHPIRLRILQELTTGTRCVTNICDLLGVAQPNVSQHLAMLKRNGLVRCDKRGVLRCYTLVNPHLVRGLLGLLAAEIDVSPARASAPTRSRGKGDGQGRGR